MCCRFSLFCHSFEPARHFGMPPRLERGLSFLFPELICLINIIPKIFRAMARICILANNILYHQLNLRNDTFIFGTGSPSALIEKYLNKVSYMWLYYSQ